MMDIFHLNFYLIKNYFKKRVYCISTTTRHIWGKWKEKSLFMEYSVKPSRLRRLYTNVSIPILINQKGLHSTFPQCHNFELSARRLCSYHHTMDAFNAFNIAITVYDSTSDRAVPMINHAFHIACTFLHHGYLFSCQYPVLNLKISPWEKVKNAFLNGFPNLYWHEQTTI